MAPNIILQNNSIGSGITALDRESLQYGLTYHGPN